MKAYIVYVKQNDSGYVTHVNSSAFLSDPSGWVQIDEGTGDRHHHAQGNYLGGPIRTMGGAYRYKLVEGVLAECTPEEIAAQEEALRPHQSATWQDAIEAQVMYTALLTDTILEG